jgi:hypothetical protein
VRHVAHLVAIPEPDDVGEVVLHDPQVIAVILDVCRQNECVTPSHDPLLAHIRRAPIDFEGQLVSFDDFRREAKAFSELREERQVATRAGGIIQQSGVRELFGTTSSGAGGKIT